MAPLIKTAKLTTGFLSSVYSGSVKANIGHLEGASGLAGIVKTVLVLENAVIPPNANFDKINPAIDAQLYNIKVNHESFNVALDSTCLHKLIYALLLGSNEFNHLARL